MYEESEIEAIIQSFEDMTETEYETASPELKNLYVYYGLEERRKNFYNKIGLVINRDHHNKQIQYIFLNIMSKLFYRFSMDSMKKEKNGKGKIISLIKKILRSIIQ